jgi:hypothetical protein
VTWKFVNVLGWHIYTYTKSAATYPQRKPDSVQDGRNNKVPTYTMNSDFMSRLEPLVNHETTQKEVDERPDIKDPGSF